MLIKDYKELTMIQLKDWTVINTEASVQQVSDMLNTNNLVTIDWIWFHRFDLKCPIKRYEPTKIEWFILSQPADIRNKLYQELEIRKEKRLDINMNIIKNILDRIK